MKLRVLIASGFFFLCGCTHQDDTRYDNYIHEALKANVKGFDPVVSSDLYAGIVMGQLYEGLMQYSYLERPTKAEPLLADGMPTISKDGLTYTFKIRHGIMFQDDPSFKATNGKGREVVAEDFIYSWKRTADSKYSPDAFWIFDGKIKGFSEWRDAASHEGKVDYTKPVEGLTTPDPYTLKITLNKPYPQLLYVLTMIGASVVPHEALEAYGQDFQNHPVGTGPYRFKSWQRNAQIVLDRNPTFHEEAYPSKGEESDKTDGHLADAGKKLPLNDGVIFTEAVENQPRWLNFRKGNTDWVEIPKDNFDNTVKNGEIADPQLKAQGVVLTKWPDPEITFDSFNMDDPILGKNKYLRQAMSLAADPKPLIHKFYNDHAIPAQGPIPPTLSGYDPKRVNPYRQFNLEKAKALLTKAGYPDGKGLPELIYDINDGSAQRQIVELFQQEMAQIGIKIKINMVTWPEFMDKIKKRKAQIIGMAWSADYPDAENFLQLFYGPNSSPGPNNANYNNPVYDKLYEQASIMQDGPARNAIYQHMVDILVEDCPWIFEAHREQYILTHGWFKNYKRNLVILNYVKYYRIESKEKAELRKKL